MSFTDFVRALAFSASQPARQAPRLAILLGFAACSVAAAAQEVVAVAPVQPAMGTVSLGTANVGRTQSFPIVFHLTQQDTITGVSADKGPYGLQEIAFDSISGNCALNATAPASTTLCTLQVSVTPLLAGFRTGTLRIVTSLGGTSLLPVSYTALGAQIAFTPGILTNLHLADRPTAIATDAQGNVYFAGRSSLQIFRYDALTLAKTVFAGDGLPGDSGDGSPATGTHIGTVIAMAFSPAGDLYFIGDGAAAGTQAVRKISLATGKISSVTQIPTQGEAGIAVDASGIVFVTSPSDTVLGLRPVVPGTTYQSFHCATLPNPTALALDGSDTLYIASGARIYKTAETHTACSAPTVYAGTGTPGFSGDGGPAASAELSGKIAALAADGANDLYLADAANYRVRRIDAGTHIIQTIAGTGAAGYAPAGGLATAVAIQGLDGLAFLPTGDFLTSDSVDDALGEIDVVTSTLAFDSTPVGQSDSGGPKHLALTNIGTQPVVFSPPAPGIFNPDAPDSYEVTPQGGCPLLPFTPDTPLPPGTSCTESIAFEPLYPGPNDAFLTFTDNAVGGRQQVALQGAGTLTTHTIVVVSPSSANFGNVTANTTAGPIVLTVTNEGSSAAEFFGYSLTDTRDFSFTATCPIFPAVLTPGRACSVAVFFTPHAPGNDSATLTLNDNSDGSHPQSITLTGSGAAGKPIVLLSPSSANFTNTKVGGQSGPITVTVSDESAFPAILTGIALTDKKDFSYTTTCAPALPANTSCSIAITFSPQSAGAHSATLTLNDNSDGSHPQSITLTGNGN